MKKSNKLIAGYHILMMISTAEGELDAKADEVIQEYLSVESLVRLNLDDELDEIIQLNEEDCDAHFIKKAEDFYDDSTPSEREDFKLFAQDLIRADEDISQQENHCYRLLLRTWNRKEKEATVEEE